MADTANINAGVPPGNILSSILYYIFSDQPTTLNTIVIDYAVDKVRI